MANTDDFVVSSAALAEAQAAMNDIIPLYPEVISKIKTASENLIDKSNWSGAARDEFKATYRIVEHYLTDDSDRISSLSEIIEGFQEIYDTLDIDSAKKVYETITDKGSKK